MDDAQFDALTRTFRSRRTALTGLAGGLVALLGLPRADDAAAHNPLPACKGIKNAARRRACRRRARAHIRDRHTCKSRPVAVTCGNRCGSMLDTCGKAIDCPCPAGKACLSNHTCSRTCTMVGEPGDCPMGCLCGVNSTEDSTTLHCIAPVTCIQVPQVCTATD